MGSTTHVLLLYPRQTMHYTRLKVECNNKDTTRIVRKYGMKFNFGSLANETAKFNSAKHSMFVYEAMADF